MTTALVIGAGPAGLMAAEVLAKAGASVVIADQMPSPARKFLMAGKSGLNLTKAEDLPDFLAAYPDMPAQLAAAVTDFGPQQVVDWAQGLAQDVFTGSTGRVFPKAMKASPLLRAWLARLEGLGVTLRRRWRWVGVEPGVGLFETPDGAERTAADIIILAMGGGSWRRLGSDGDWLRWLPNAVSPFVPSNVGVTRHWSHHMDPHLGRPIKAIALKAGNLISRGEIVLSRGGIEGGGIYALSPALRSGAALQIDLVPDLSPQQVADRWAKRRAKATVSQFLRAGLRLSPEKVALFQECKHGAAGEVVDLVKALPLRYDGLRPLDEAISTAGGLRFDALDGWMLGDRPGVFAAGEMLDWDAPTGGYLITACLATGRAAARQALAWQAARVATANM